MNMYTVYKLTNKINQKVYFGYTKADNTLSRQQELYRHNKELHNDMLNYGLDSFIKEDIFKTTSLHEALEYESKMIAENNTLWPNGYNHITLSKYKLQSEIHKSRLSKATSGRNNPMYGKHQSEEAKRKISKSNTGKKWNVEQKERQSKRLKGRQLSDEHREKISKSNKLAWSDLDLRHKLSEKLKGRQFSDEHREKISKGNKGKIRTDEFKHKISESLKGKTRTEKQKKNYSKSASNRIWYTNGVENKSCNKNDLDKTKYLESLGFYRGITRKEGTK